MPTVTTLSKLQKNKVELAKIRQVKPVESLLERNAPAWKLRPNRKEVK